MVKFKNIINAIKYAEAEGFRIGEVHCKLCDLLWRQLVRPEENTATLQCPRCGGKISSYVELKNKPKAN